VNGATADVQVGPHRIEATVFGSGQPTVVIEPAFGGSAQSWRGIAETLAQDTRVVTYDRAPYGASSVAQDGRTPCEIARDLHGVLQALDITGPLVLVGHSSGGPCVRAFAALFSQQVAGMVLVDSSHETQEQVLTPYLPWRMRLLEALTVPLIRVAPRRMLGGGDRRSLIREFRAIKGLTAADQPLARRALGGKPLIVLTRGPGSKTPVPPSWQLWHDLHLDLAQLSANHRHVVADYPDHYIHKSDPALVSAAITAVVRSACTNTPLDATSAGLPLPVTPKPRKPSAR
jgi:pimeloyl-ACP methyl ester carboxylesterase